MVKALRQSKDLSIIAEIKQASPSSGLLRQEFNHLKILKAYEQGGVAAISIVTEEEFFLGKLKYLKEVKENTGLPVLRKDFIIDEIQVHQSRALGADAVLLIARILGRKKLIRMLSICREMGMDALTEVHGEEDLDMALTCGADIVGINNRDLSTFEVDLATTKRLIKQIPRGHVVVSESGIKSGSDVVELGKLGVHAVLVGTTLMKSGDMGAKARELSGKGQ